jgi:hypothetical protein
MLDKVQILFLHALLQNDGKPKHDRFREQMTKVTVITKHQV